MKELIVGVLAFGGGVAVARLYWNKAIELGSEALTYTKNDFAKARAHIRALVGKL